MERLAFLRDVKKLVILAMFSDDELWDRLVLKGGNLLDIVYQLSARSSVDIDLSMSDEFDDLNRLRSKVLKALESTFLDCGYVVFDFKLTEEPPKLSKDMKDFWGGYRVQFKLIDAATYRSVGDDIGERRKYAAVVGERSSTVFRIDISKHEFCDDKQRFQIDDHSVYGYSPELFVAEKLRAICQQMDEYVQIVRLHPRPRARDFVDIQVITEHYGIDFGREDFHEIVRRTFGIKMVPLRLLGQILDSKEQHEDDFQVVQATVHPDFDLEAFDYYFDYVCRQCELLEPLWCV